MKKRARSRKHHFQLLELMVAAFILLVCIAPAMRIFTSIYQAQQEIVRENQRDHLAHLVHSKVVELLYKRQLHISEATKGHPVEIKDVELITQLQKFSYVCEANLVAIRSFKPKNQEHPSKYLVKIVIKFKDISPKAQLKSGASKKKYENQDSTESFYDYYVYIDAGAREKKEKSKKAEGAGTDQKAGEGKSCGDDEDAEENDEDGEECDDTALTNTKKKSSAEAKPSPSGLKNK